MTTTIHQEIAQSALPHNFRAHRARLRSLIACAATDAWVAGTPAALRLSAALATLERAPLRGWVDAHAIRNRAIAAIERYERDLRN
jgi:hypothetical protein